MFKNNFWTPPKSPSEMFKPNAIMITKTRGANIQN